MILAPLALQMMLVVVLTYYYVAWKVSEYMYVCLCQGPCAQTDSVRRHQAHGAGSVRVRL